MHISYHCPIKQGESEISYPWISVNSVNCDFTGRKKKNSFPRIVLLRGWKGRKWDEKWRIMDFLGEKGNPPLFAPHGTKDINEAIWQPYWKREWWRIRVHLWPSSHIHRMNVWKKELWAMWRMPRKTIRLSDNRRSRAAKSYELRAKDVGRAEIFIYSSAKPTQ